MAITRIYSTPGAAERFGLIHAVELRRRDGEPFWYLPEAWLEAQPYEGETLYASFQLEFDPKRGHADPFCHPFVFYFADPVVAMAFKIRWG